MMYSRAQLKDSGGCNSASCPARVNGNLLKRLPLLDTVRGIVLCPTDPRHAVRSCLMRRGASCHKGSRAVCPWSHLRRFVPGIQAIRTFLIGLLTVSLGSCVESTAEPAEPVVSRPLASWCDAGACDATQPCAGNAECVDGRCRLIRCSRLGEPCEVEWGDLGCEPGLQCQDGQCISGSRCSCEDGWCDADSTCVRDPCRDTVSCTRFGKCSSVGGFCMAWSNEDCLASEGCALWGECAAGDLPLTAPEDERPRHRTCWPATPCDAKLGTEGVNACDEIGLCFEEQGRCIAQDLGACEQSLACITTGACSLYEGECWRQVEDADECTSGGAVDDVCGAFGFCELVDGLYCQTGTDAHCTGSFLCEAFGECYAHDGECWARPTREGRTN